MPRILVAVSFPSFKHKLNEAIRIMPTVLNSLGDLINFLVKIATDRAENSLEAIQVPST